MRKVEKNYDKVPTILKSNRAENHLKKIIENDAKAQTAIYRNDEVLDELDKLYYKKCGYCEKKTHNYEIEHYRPKDEKLYPYLSYEWSNLFPVCHACNKSKSNKFPIAGKRNEDTDLRDIRKLNEIEMPLVLSPEVDFPEEHFDFDIFTGEIIGKTDRANKTIEICELNSKDLIFYRKKGFDEILEKIELVNIANHNVKTAVFNIIAKKLSSNKKKDEEFSMFWQAINEKFVEQILPKFQKEKKEQMLNAFKNYTEN